MARRHYRGHSRLPLRRRTHSRPIRHSDRRYSRLATSTGLSLSFRLASSSPPTVPGCTSPSRAHISELERPKRRRGNAIFSPSWIERGGPSGAARSRWGGGNRGSAGGHEVLRGSTRFYKVLRGS